MSLLAAPIVGVLLAWSLAALPGPANALIATEASRRGLRSGVVTGLGAITADVGMFALMWLGVVRVIDALPWARVALGLVGALLLGWFAWGAFRGAGRPVAQASGAGGYVKCFLVIVTSPINWVWWGSVGTTLFASLGLAVVVGFFGGLLLWVVFWSLLTREGGRRIPRFGEGVAYVSAVVLAAFAIALGWVAVSTAISLA